MREKCLRALHINTIGYPSMLTISASEKQLTSYSSIPTARIWDERPVNYISSIREANMASPISHHIIKTPNETKTYAPLDSDSQHLHFTVEGKKNS